MTSTILTFSAPDGVQLVAEAWGDPSNPGVLFAHGGGQTRHSWSSTARTMAAQGWYTLSYDQRGHGDSGWSVDGGYEVNRFAGDMQVIARHFSSPPGVVGASLGGMSAMLCAGEQDSALFSSVTLVDVTPYLNSEGLNNIADFMSAHKKEGFGSLEQAAALIAQYKGQPARSDVNGLKKNLRLRDGRWYWHWDPSFFSPEDGAKIDPNDLVEAVANISLPLLLIRGRMSDVVTQAEVDKFIRLAPDAEFVDVDKAGHMVVGDRNDVFTTAVMEFLNRHRQTAPQYPGAPV